MTLTIASGPEAGKLARYLTTRDLSRAVSGQGKYAPLCDHGGVLINDPVLLKLSDDRFWLSIADGDDRLTVQTRRATVTALPFI